MKNMPPTIHDKKARQLIAELCVQLRVGCFSENDFCTLFLLLREHEADPDNPFRWFADAMAHRNRNKSFVYGTALGARAISMGCPPELVLNEQDNLKHDKRSRLAVEKVIADGRQAWLSAARNAGPLFPSGSLFAAMNQTLGIVGFGPVDDSRRDAIELMAMSVVQGVTFGNNFSQIYLVRNERHFIAVIGPLSSVSIHLNLMEVPDPTEAPDQSFRIWFDDVLTVALHNGIVTTTSRMVS